MSRNVFHKAFRIFQAEIAAKKGENNCKQLQQRTDTIQPCISCNLLNCNYSRVDVSPRCTAPCETLLWQPLKNHLNEDLVILKSNVGKVSRNLSSILKGVSNKEVRILTEGLQDTSVRLHHDLHCREAKTSVFSLSLAAFLTN